MGILTDPTLSRRNQIGRNLVKHNRKICICLYLLGAVWFGCLGNLNYNHATYLSENALSPGLVYSEIKVDSARFAQTLEEELRYERESHKTNIPYSWISAKMHQIGLEVYTHNFTLNYPLGSGKTFQGKNIYGILRAPRIGSTEGIVFSAPYRPPNSVHTDITSSISIMLAFADFARKKNYWSKDLIFLITDQEQLGVHAWLQAYYNGDLDESTVLNAGNLKGRAGALQAALNLEIQGFDIDFIDVKIEGLNGQLPNLDMFNLVQRLAVRESISSGYKQKSSRKQSALHSTVSENIKRMISMILTQATGVPTGNHGLFHRYRIESLTLEAVKRSSYGSANKNMGILSLLKTIEGISRSLNNLLERFHQSYFFYLLVANDRFVSIGDFMPSLVLMAGPLFIKAFLLWLDIDIDIEKSDKLKKQNDFEYLKIGVIIVFTHFLGMMSSFLPTNQTVNEIFSSKDISTAHTITLILVVISLVALFFPIFVHLNSNSVQILHIAILLELASALIIIGLLNFALGFFLATFVCPLAIMLDTNSSSVFQRLTIPYTLLVQPFVSLYICVFIFTLSSFPEQTLTDVAFTAINALMDAITFAVVDSLIYGNWLFYAIVLVLFPIWSLVWCISVKGTTSIKEKLKIA